MRKLSSVAEQARVIRSELKTAFPGVKFSVTSDSYSGGSSIHIKWVDFPTEKAVKAIASQHESIDRDQFGDILSGGNRFIFCENKWTDEARAVIEKEMTQGIDRNSYEYHYWFTQAAERVWEAMNEKEEIPENKNFRCGQCGSSHVRESANDGSMGWCQYCTEKIDIVPVETTPAPVEGVAVTLNDEKQGVEIRFAEKPAAGVIAMLKENGFRWSKRGFWYAKQTPERLTLARALSETPDITEPEQETAGTGEVQPEPEPMKAANIIQFPCARKEPKQPQYTPEQQLKLEVVRSIIGDKADEGIQSGMTPDEMFAALAVVVMGDNSQVH